MRKIFDKTVWKFILVGIINTLFGMTIMFGLYNLLHCSYWGIAGILYVTYIDPFLEKLKCKIDKKSLKLLFW